MRAEDHRTEEPGTPQRSRGSRAGRGLIPVVLGLVAVIVSSACTDANGTESGGDLVFDASTPVAAEASTNPDEGLGTGTTFTDLYVDFFGPAGRAKCSGNGACHGSASQPGAMASGGYICPDAPAGTDASTIDPALKSQCRATMISSGIITPGKSFAASYMHNVIRKATSAAGDENNMPKSPYTYTFSDASVARIAAWVEGGALDN